jgi:hypothetical protein
VKLQRAKKNSEKAKENVYTLQQKGKEKPRPRKNTTQKTHQKKKG